MKFFEFHFRPRDKDRVRTQSFCYEPKASAEKKLGSLCMAGELTNILGPNKNLMEDLAEIVKSAYYSPAENAEEALEHALDAANAFLANESKKGNVGWLGNLNFTILAFAEDNLYFGKIGNIKIIMARRGELLNVAGDLEGQHVISYPTRMFSHMVCGTIERGDKIIVLTAELFDLFEEINIVSEFAALPEGHEEKTIKTLIRPYEKQLKDYSGFLLMASVDKIISSRGARSLTWPKLRMPSIIAGRKPDGSDVSPATKIKAPGIALPKIIPVGAGKNAVLAGTRQYIEKMEKIMQRLGPGSRPKKVLLLAAFTLILASGFFLSAWQEKRAAKETEQKLLEIQQKLWQAQNDILADRRKEANDLLQKSLIQIADLENSSVKKSVPKVKNEIVQKLTELNNIEELTEITAEFYADPEMTNPAKMLWLAGNLYLFDDASRTMYLHDLSQKLKPQRTELAWPVDLIATLSSFIAFYDKNGQNIIIRDGENIKLKAPYDGFSPENMAAFANSLYFLDKENAQIIRYALSPNPENELLPSLWMAYPDLKLRDAVSLTIDGSIWILEESGVLRRYWGGQLQETIKPDFWPPPQRPSKIYTASSLPYIYILDPPEKRLIIIDKKGGIIKQYRSEKLDKLKDFAISEDGKNIYLLSGREVYKVERR